MTSRAVAVVGIVALCSCVVGRPLEYSKGTAWVLPLLGALEGGPPVIPVRVNGKGPYLFALNLDSTSHLHPNVATELELWSRTSDRLKLVDDKDNISHEQLTFALVESLSMGNLTVSPRHILVVEPGGSYNGQPLMGTIGRDVVPDSVIWALDRDRQMLHIAAQGHLDPPGGAEKIEPRINYRRIFVDAKINQSLKAHFRVFFNGRTAIWPEIAGGASLPHSGGVWKAANVEVGNARADAIEFEPYRDARARRSDHDGLLGLRFWSRFHITMNMHEGAMWLKPRTADVAALTGDRLGRWGDRFTGCANPACVKLSVERERIATKTERTPGEGPNPAAAAASGTLIVSRDATKHSAPYDILIEAVDERGATLGLPYLRIALPASSTDLHFALSSISGLYARAAGFQVIDATPFPPPCTLPNGCLWIMQ